MMGKIKNICPFCGKIVERISTRINGFCGCGAKYYFREKTWLNRKTGEEIKMVDTITIKQYDELYNNRHEIKEFNKLLEEYTGIEAKPYTGYQYFDGAGNYIGDSDSYSVQELLKNAYIKIVNKE